jgi:hypothetical protein
MVLAITWWLVRMNLLRVSSILDIFWTTQPV